MDYSNHSIELLNGIINFYGNFVILKQQKMYMILLLLTMVRLQLVQ